MSFRTTESVYEYYGTRRQPHFVIFHSVPQMPWFVQRERTQG